MKLACETRPQTPFPVPGRDGLFSLDFELSQGPTERQCVFVCWLIALVSVTTAPQTACSSYGVKQSARHSYKTRFVVITSYTVESNNFLSVMRFTTQFLFYLLILFVCLLSTDLQVEIAICISAHTQQQQQQQQQNRRSRK